MLFQTLMINCVGEIVNADDCKMRCATTFIYQLLNSDKATFAMVAFPILNVNLQIF